MTSTFLKATELLIIFLIAIITIIFNPSQGLLCIPFLLIIMFRSIFGTLEN